MRPGDERVNALSAHTVPDSTSLLPVLSPPLFPCNYMDKASSPNTINHSLHPLPTASCVNMPIKGQFHSLSTTATPWLGMAGRAGFTLSPPHFVGPALLNDDVLKHSSM